MSAELNYAASLARAVAPAWDAEAIGSVVGHETGVLLTWPDEGFALGRVVEDEAELLLVAVEPARRRQGIGGRLLDAFHGAVQARGAGTVFLEVAARNAAARALYDRAGYVQVGRRAGYYKDGDDAIVLTCAMTSAR